MRQSRVPHCPTTERRRLQFPKKFPRPFAVFAALPGAFLEIRLDGLVFVHRNDKLIVVVVFLEFREIIGRLIQILDLSRHDAPGRYRDDIGVLMVRSGKFRNLRVVLH